mgnify:CR=1 FL=1
MSNYIICSIGLTAAGKTTTLRRISSLCGINFISEGAIKRKMVNGEFSIKNSTDEELRSKGYRKAISLAFDYIQAERKDVIIDASFHQQFRRNWIYEEIAARKLDDIAVIWIYCVCNNESLIEERIHKRFISPIKCADNQANTIGVYNYTKSTFDDVSIDKFDRIAPTYLIVLDTEKNRVINRASTVADDVLELKINKWRELWENYL